MNGSVFFLNRRGETKVQCSLVVLKHCWTVYCVPLTCLHCGLYVQRFVTAFNRHKYRGRLAAVYLLRMQLQTFTCIIPHITWLTYLTMIIWQRSHWSEILQTVSPNKNRDAFQELLTTPKVQVELRRSYT